MSGQITLFCSSLQDKFVSITEVARIQHEAAVEDQLKVYGLNRLKLAFKQFPALQQNVSDQSVDCLYFWLTCG